MEKAVEAKCEGLILKYAGKDSFYDITGNRSSQWAKYKSKMFVGEMSDTLDLVPLGAYFGRGSRKGIYGSYLMGAYSEHMRTFQAFCNLGTGFT